MSSEQGPAVKQAEPSQDGKKAAGSVSAGRGRGQLRAQADSFSPGGSYVNSARHLTGGPSRGKLSEEELQAKMDRARKQNDAIAKRRELVEKDKEHYSEITEKERQERKERARKAIEDKKVQLAIDEERNKSRARKLEKLDRRDWDAEKSSQDGLWQTNYKEYSRDDWGGSRGRGRGSYRGSAEFSRRGRGRQRDGHSSQGTPDVDLKDRELFPALAPAAEAASKPPECEDKS